MLNYKFKKILINTTLATSIALSISCGSSKDRKWQKLSSSTKHELKVPLNLVILSPDKWSKEEVLIRVRRAEEIYSQCSVSFNPIKLTILKNPQFDSFNYSNKEDINLLQSLNIKERPLVFFANKNTSPLSFDAYTWIDDHDVNEVRKKASFIFNSWKRTEYYLDIFDNITNYSVLAHELGHTLLNLDGHTDIKNNVMAKKSAPMGDGFTQEQCENIRDFAKKL